MGWSGLAWHFLCSEILFIRPQDPAKSHQPAANKHTGLHGEHEEQHVSKLVLDTFDDLNYSFSAKPAEAVDQEKLQIWVLLA